MIRLKVFACIFVLFICISIQFFCTDPVRPTFDDYTLSFLLFKDSTCTDTITKDDIMYSGDVVHFMVKLEPSHKIVTIELLLKDSIGNELYVDTSLGIAATDTAISLGTTQLLAIGTNTLMLNFSKQDTVLDTTLSFTVTGVAPTIGNNKTIDTLGQNIADSLFCLYFSVSSGTEPLTHTWYKDGVEFMPGTFTDTLRFLTLAESDLGDYKCVVENNWGRDTTDDYIFNTIHRSPSILNGKIIQASGTPEQDSSFFIYVEATGSESLQYTWSHNGLMVVGVNDDTLPISDSLTFADTGAYVCTVSNIWNSKVIVDVSSPYTLKLGNRPPKWKSDTIYDTVCEGSMYYTSVSDSCTDPDNDKIEFSLVLLEKPLTDAITPQGFYLYIPTFFESGSYNVTILAGDGNTFSPCVLALEVKNKNRKPVFQNTLPAKSYRILAGEELKIPFKAIDPDSDDVSYSLGATTLPHSDSISFGDTSLTWQSNIPDSGLYTLKVHAADSSDTAVATVNIAVGANINLPPSIAIGNYLSGDTIKISEMQTFKCTVTVTDPDSLDKPLLSQPLNKPDLAHFVITTVGGELSYVPDFQVSSRDSNHTFGNMTFTATDQNANSPLTDTFIVHLEVVDSNTAPVLDTINSVTVKGSQLISFALSATDINGDSLFFTMKSNPDSAIIIDSGNGKGLFNWQTTFHDADTYNVVITVSDGDLTDNQNVTLIVEEVCGIRATCNRNSNLFTITKPSYLKKDSLNLLEPGTEIKLVRAEGTNNLYSAWRVVYWDATNPFISDTFIVNDTTKALEIVADTHMDIILELVSKDMVYINAKGSTFKMGLDPLFVPVHDVSFTYDFCMDEEEVNQEDYNNLMGVNPSKFTNDVKNPVENLTWFDAALYCNARSKEDSFDTVYTFSSFTGVVGNGCTGLDSLKINYDRNGYRLPTEAEWEYACRGGSDSLFFWGDSAKEFEKYAWANENSGDTTHVGNEKDDNPFELYDITGNVHEWINDWQEDYSSGPLVNPLGPDAGTEKIFRGGSIMDSALIKLEENFFQSGYRNHKIPRTQDPSIGFRVVRPRTFPFKE